MVIDKRAYENYRKCDDAELRPIIDANIAVLDGARSDMAYAQLKFSGSQCAFLTQERRCRIQEKLGEGALSRACATFPRAVSMVDGVLECSLYMSCPEAARAVLFDPDGMARTRSVRNEAFRFASPPTLETSERKSGAKPYEHFLRLRDLVVSIICDRSYAVWERLLIVGLLCDHLNNAVSDGKSESVGEIVDGYVSQIAAGLYRGAFIGVAHQPHLQAEFVEKWMDARIEDGNVPERFTTMYGLYREGAGGDAAVEGRRYFRSFMDERPHVLENYLVNYVFRTLFPFGPQKALYLQRRRVIDEYVLLVVHYVMIRTLLAGVSGVRKEGFGENDVVLVVQSFAKAIEHNLPFLNRILSVLEGRGLDSLVYLAALVRDE